MISYSEFNEIFNGIDSNREPEIEIYFKNRKNTYMIIKYEGFITFAKCGTNGQSKVCEYNSLEELYNTKTIDNIILKNEWNNIEDIIFDCTFSIITDKEDIYEVYRINQ